MTVRSHLVGQHIWNLVSLAAVCFGVAGGPLAQSDPGADPSAPEPTVRPFDRPHLVDLARDLASKPYVAPANIEGWLRKLDYDSYRRIRYRPEARIWRDEGHDFQLDMLHVGAIFNRRVELATVHDGVVEPIEFSPTRFDYDGMLPEEVSPTGAGYSGVRLRWPLNRPEVHDEVLVFQGASYFRAVARGQLYGLSARGLAIRTADPKGEEFPWFRQFWIEHPEPQSRTIRVHALLDSESLTGAYSFTVTPGDETTIDVEMTLFARRDVASFGVAPLTSMFLFDAVNRSRFDDYREAVHDSDGLQMVTGAGDRIWRPLANPRTLQVSAFRDDMPKGFGLVQRRRSFTDYGDLEARYEKRPSAWVEPLTPFGPGEVQLVEIPVDTEFNDNIVAFWKPKAALAKDEERSWKYRLHFCGSAPDSAPVARVVDTRTGLAPNDGGRLLVVDFEQADGVEDETEFVAETSAGRIVGRRLERLPGSRRLRVTLEFEPGDADVAEFRVHLVCAGEVCSEIWLHRWTRS